MSLSKQKKKVDFENRQFNKDWTEKYAYIETPEGKPLCLLCTKVNAVSKEYNLRRHFKTTHEKFDEEYPPGTDF